MTPPAPSLLRCLFLGLSALVPPTFTKLQLQVAPGFSNLRVVEGSDVVLPVWYTKLGQESPDPSWKVLSAIWYLQKKDEKTKQVLAYFSTSNVIKESRVSLIYPMPSHNLSLRLENLQEQDSGFYYCSVNVEGNKDFKDHDSSKMVELNVLIPPAPPSCTLQGVPRAGANVTLSCQSPRSKPPAQYQWTGPSLYTKTFSPRFLDMVRGFLNLTNLSTSMSGVYVCKAHNEVGSAQCNVTMEVSSGQ
ncbi:endothelial cell-selective adhesion molecule isoform X2 [Erinaceus europaeus]|uniref:Endothelial cell-selective adhesion molecule isoform X2 n=1 Tax=Erinaceus europaeus TaxID=9365 RepID=A0ABM3WGW2_ERIEU|nr:endothelial cell-selective adhesion molecule isoform X2 [Erinaceus europaeus]